MKNMVYDVVCVGGGGAGVTAALTAERMGARVALICKEPVGSGDTRISMGAIAHPGILPGDGPDSFVRDILQSGAGLSEPSLVKEIAQKCRQAAALAESYGLLFKRDSQGEISKEVAGKAGGHSFPRSISTPPAEGLAFGNSLRAASARGKVDIWEETLAYQVITHKGKAAALACLDMVSGEPFVLETPAVVLAGGGAGWLFYPHTDNSRGLCGDSLALAFNVGAELIDLEQVQYIPFGLTHPPSMEGVFLGEPNLAAPAGILYNAGGQAVLQKIHKLNRAEVTKAMALELAKGEGTSYGGLLLDLSPNLACSEGRELWQKRASKGQLDILRWAYGEKAFRWQEPLDVAPTVHYLMGGIKVDTRGHTCVPGLFAAGQAAGGLHGGNRLGSVSLAELYVFGQLAGEEACLWAKNTHKERVPGKLLENALAKIAKLFEAQGGHTPLQVTTMLQHSMWQTAGPAREKQKLEKGLQKISELKILAENDLHIPAHKSYNLGLVEALELSFMLTTAPLLVGSALARQESRGAHLRLDYPQRDDKNWLCHLVWKQTPEGPSLSREEVGNC